MSNPIVDMTSPTKNQSKHGLAFEVILDNAKSNTPARLTPHNTPNRNITNDDIKQKLQKAEERRQVGLYNFQALSTGLNSTVLFHFHTHKSLEIMKLSAINEKFQKIEEAAKIREEYNLNFSKQAEQKLQSKMESNKENRNNLMNNLMEKLKKTVNIPNLFFV